MARKNLPSPTGDFSPEGKKSKPSGSGRNIRRWISTYLDKDDLSWLESQRTNMFSIVFEFLADLPETYNLSSKFDDKTDRWLSTLICADSNDPNDGLALTSRASTRALSLYALAYICVFKLEWRWEREGDGISGDFG